LIDSATGEDDPDPVRTRDEHGNGKDRNLMGFPREWEYDQRWDGDGMEIGIKRMGMGIETLE